MGFGIKAFFSSKPPIVEEKKLINEKEIKKTGVVNFEFIEALKKV